MFIGLSIIWLFALGTQGNSVAFRPVTALWIVAIPLWDMTAIVYRRLRKGQSPFIANRDHLHHIFMRLGLSSPQALFVILAVSSICSSIGMLGEYFQIPEYLMLIGFVAFFGVYNYALVHVWVLQRRLKRIFGLSEMRVDESLDDNPEESYKLSVD